MKSLLLASVFLLIAACNSSSGGTSSSTGTGTGTVAGASTSAGASGTTTGASPTTGGNGSATTGAPPPKPFIGSLGIVTLGSTVDPTNGDQNPYGLAIAPLTAGFMTEGDLVICNFNDAANVQGNGTTIEVLHPVPGSMPTRLVQDNNLKGCAAVAVDPAGNTLATAFSADLVPKYDPNGTLISTLASGPWSGPWGDAYAPAFGRGNPTFAVSNATSGTVVRASSSSPFKFDTIITGFTLNAGHVPGMILGPAGLTYDLTSDTLFAVDSNKNRLLAFKGYSTLPANAIALSGDSFTGPFASSARVVFSGAPLNGPLSAAELFNGDLIVANTADNNLVEISQSGALQATQNLDPGAAGALFGLAVSGLNAGEAQIFFNDDNDNTVKVMSNTGIVGSLPITTIGSTIDPTNGDQNPYGLAIAPETAGSLTQGDLVICNFNDSANVQGNGTTIEVLHPTADSHPTRLVQDPNLKGCAAIALDPSDDPWATAFSANLAPYYSPSGTLISTLPTGPWSGPWGETYAPAFGSGTAAFIVSNATAGTIVRVTPGASPSFATIVTGFSLNSGAVPGNILGPAGLTYDVKSDTLFVVDSNMNRVVAFDKFSTLAANAIAIKPDGSFSGTSKDMAHAVFVGSPLNAPLSAAELFNGDLIIANTADNNLVELSQSGQINGVQNLDPPPDAVGALFGLAVSGSTAATTKIYFNNDNDNTVKVLTVP